MTIPRIRYKGWELTYNPKPIPDRRFDYDAVHKDYDGPEDSRVFSAGSVDEAMREIDDQQGIQSLNAWTTKLSPYNPK